MRVYVKNLRHQPLMPTTPKKAKLLLRQGKAKVIQQTPFTIQLLHPTVENKQDISLGIDAGTKHIGISAATENRVLFEGEVKLRTIFKRFTGFAPFVAQRKAQPEHPLPQTPVSKPEETNRMAGTVCPEQSRHARKSNSAGPPDFADYYTYN